MRHRCMWLAIGIGLVLASALAVAITRTPSFRRGSRPPTLAAPPDEEVVEVRASLREAEIGFRETPEFVVPAEHVPLVLRWLRPPRYVPRPPIFPEKDEL